MPLPTPLITPMQMKKAAPFPCTGKTTCRRSPLLRLPWLLVLLLPWVSLCRRLSLDTTTIIITTATIADEIVGQLFGFFYGIDGSKEKS